MGRLTNQKVFDKVARHLLTQGKRAQNENRDCMYRAPDGSKCEAGCLIPDDLYDKSIEGTCIDGDSPTHQLLKKLVRSPSFVGELQSIHDDACTYSWKEELSRLARKRNLSSAVLDEFPNWTPKE